MGLQEDVKNKLDNVLKKLGIDVDYWDDLVKGFCSKLELLEKRNKYQRLSNALFSVNNMDDLKSLIFEASFAYDFESKGGSLEYEVRQISNSLTSIDFLYETLNKKKIYFELRLIQQRKWVSDSIQKQINQDNTWQISLNGQDDHDETIRIQNLLLSKCQDKNGTPIKFFSKHLGIYNIIVIYVSDLYLSMIDIYDCLLVMYGDAGVDEFYRRGVFGLFQQYDKSFPARLKDYYEKFKHFRETIHGVLFIKNSSRGSTLLELDLEYCLIFNDNLVQKEDCERILSELSKYMKPWPRSD